MVNIWYNNDFAPGKAIHNNVREKQSSSRRTRERLEIDPLYAH